MRKKLINIHSSELAGGGAKLPDPQQIEYGEIAVNYAKGAETIAIRNSEDEIVEFKPGGGDDVYTVDGQLLTLIMASGTPEEEYSIMFQASSGDTVYGDIDGYLGGMDSFFEAARQNMRIVFSTKQPAEGVLEIGEPLFMSMSGLNMVYCKFNGIIVGGSPVSNCVLMMMAQNGMFVGGFAFEPETIVYKSGENIYVDDYRKTINCSGLTTVRNNMTSKSIETNDFLYPEETLYYVYKDDYDQYHARKCSEWDGGLGFVIGIMIVPPDVLPDGKARIMALNYVDSAGTETTDPQNLRWTLLNNSAEPLSYHNQIPIVNPLKNEIIKLLDLKLNNYSAILPQEGLSETLNPLYRRTGWKYGSYYEIAPSPFSGTVLNPVYAIEERNGTPANNAFSDFDGLGNTRILCQSADTYVAANAAHLYHQYNDGGLEWYLPAFGELCFLPLKIKSINDILSITSRAAQISTYVNYGLWSSTQNTGGPYALDIRGDEYNTADVTYWGDFKCVRPFAMIDRIVYDDSPYMNLNTRIESYTETKQNKIDNTLSTSSKEIVGAINELASYVGVNGTMSDEMKTAIKDAVKEYLSGVTKQITLSESGDTLSVGFSDDAVFGGEDLTY